MKNSIFPSFKILLVDDEPAWLDSLSLALERKGGITNLIVCDDSRKVEEIVSAENIGLVVLDLTMPHLSGQDLLKYFSENHPFIKVIILTGLNQIETAVSCMKQGAFDYYVKTEEEERLVKGILSAIHLIELQSENCEMSARLLDDKLESPQAFKSILTVSNSMRSIFKYIESVAKSSQPILITGESGVGKELLAQSVHDLSERKGSMVALNVAGLDDTMFSDTLFGHVKGAFTGATSLRNGLIEKAADGTLFLDEIGDLSLGLQVKLLRVLNNGEYFSLGSDKSSFSKARIVLATNQDLKEKMESGMFRKDLYYRLLTHRVNVPPLRDRKEDIAVLLDHFINEASKDFGKEIQKTSRDLISYLQSFDYPGNIREFRAIIFDAIARTENSTLETSTFEKIMGIANNRINGQDVRSENNLFSKQELLPHIDEVVEQLIDEAMKRSNNNQSLASRFLGITQSALNKRLKRSGKR